MSVERQTKEKFPKQRRLYKQRRSTVASIRSCLARLGVCITRGVYGLYCGLGVACVRSCPARLGVCGTCGEVIMYAKRKKNAHVLSNASVIFCCYSFGASSSAFATAFGASASASGASAFTSASAAGAAAVSSSTTDCCTNCSFSSAVRI